MFTLVYLRLSTFTRAFFPMYTRVDLCLHFFCLCLPLFTRVYLCLPIDTLQNWTDNGLINYITMTSRSS